MGIEIVDVTRILDASIIDRTYGIREVLRLLHFKGVDLSSFSCLDLFAGDGTFCTDLLFQEVSKMECVEYDNETYMSLLSNLPKATSHYADSIEWIKNNQRDHQLIHIDNPQNIYGNYCEYFDVINHVGNMFNGDTILIHNINIAPYNFNKLSDWSKKRNEFYNISDSSILDLDYVKNHSINLFLKNNINVKWITFVPREKYNDSIYLYYLVCHLKKKK